jgi:8-oxo-dGTP pyrophosphatase MutT (NUDIX family)
MHRNGLLNLLHAYMPTDSLEQAVKEQILSFVHEHPDCFERSLAKGHITASAWVLNKNYSHVLLMHHAKLDMWVQLGGHCDGNSDVRAVALKEAQEESGIQDLVILSPHIFDIDIHKVPVRGHEQEHYHYDIRFLLAAPGDITLHKNHESKELRWFSRHNALPTQSRTILRMHAKWLAMEYASRVIKSYRHIPY